MDKVKITIEHNGKTLFGSIMRIKSTSLGFEDHGILTAWLSCEAPGSGGQGVGGYCLDKSVKADDYEESYKTYREGTAYGLDHIIKIIETVGVYKWEELVRKDIIVLREKEIGWGSTAVGFASLDGERILIFKEHAEAWKAREGEE